jgi:hypothetical protein
MPNHALQATPGYGCLFIVFRCPARLIKKNQDGEEGRRIFSESVEENPPEKDPILNRPFCIHSISPVAIRPYRHFSICIPTNTC